MSVMRRARGALLALVATLILSVAGDASAIMLSVGTTNYTAVWREVRFIVESQTTTCNLTLEGSFHSSTFKKVEGALIGHIARASLGTCTGFSTTVLRETLPWHVQYGGFEGALPAIERLKLRLVGLSLRMNLIGTNCLARSEANRPAVLRANREAGGSITSLTGERAATIPFSNCSIFNVGLDGTTSSFTRTPLTLIGELPSLSPSPIEFGRIEPEGVASRAVTIRAGTEALEVRGIRLSSGTNFAILDPNRCVGSRLAERSSCVFKAIFAAPRETERAFNDTITVETSVGALEDSVSAST
jgi:hypothetical protein